MQHHVSWLANEAGAKYVGMARTWGEEAQGHGEPLMQLHQAARCVYRPHLKPVACHQ